jgi:hypothetical protein
MKAHGKVCGVSLNRLSYSIAGREAIPVRAIPFITGWMISPDQIARDMARRNVDSVFCVLRNLTAHHLVADTLASILPKEWDDVCVRMDALKARLDAKHANWNAGYAEWREASFQLLPAGVFVWKEEFEAELGQRQAEGEVSLTAERPGDRQLNYQPMIDRVVWANVIEGFEGQQERAQFQERRKRGRYTLREVCDLLVSTGERYETVLASLSSAIRSGDLAAFAPGEEVARTFARIASHSVVYES